MSERRPTASSRTRSSAGRFLQSGDSFGHVTIIDIGRVDLRETLQRRFQFARRFLGHTQIIQQGEGTFGVHIRGAQGAFVPDSGDAGLAFFHEGETQQGAALHGVAERFAAVRGLGDFLKFADGLFQEAYFAEGDAEIVVRLQIFILGAHFSEFGAKFIENFLQRRILERGRGLGPRLPLGGRLCLGRRRLGIRGRKFANAELIDLIRKFSEKLIGSKTAGGRGGLRILCGDFWRFLFVSRNERLGLDDQFVVLFEFEFGFFLFRRLGGLGLLFRGGFLGGAGSRQLFQRGSLLLAGNGRQRLASLSRLTARNSSSGMDRFVRGRSFDWNFEL